MSALTPVLVSQNVRMIVAAVTSLGMLIAFDCRTSAPLRPRLGMISD